MKKLKFRKAKERDRGLFLKLWKNLLMDLEKQGGEVVPNEHNLDVYGAYFDAYVAGDLDGVILFVAEDAVIMWGDLGSAVELKAKTATAWGTYVGDSLKEKGVSKFLREAAVKLLKDKGFEVIKGSALYSNEVGMESMLKFGFKKTECIAMYEIEGDN